MIIFCESTILNNNHMLKRKKSYLPESINEHFLKIENSKTVDYLESSVLCLRFYITW